MYWRARPLLRCIRPLCRAPSLLPARYLHVFSARNLKLIPFGRQKPLYDEALTWDLHSEGCVWAVLGPGASQFLSGSLQGKARASPPEARSWPFLAGRTSYLLEQVIQRVAYSTRLEAKGPSVSGEFTDYTARYGGLRDEDRLTLKEHLHDYMLQNELLPSDELITSMARRFEVENLLSMPVVALSNGQTRRARIVRALLGRPEVLILEQPFS